MTENYPPLMIPPKSGLVHPLTRPFNMRDSCILNLQPEHNTKWVDYSLAGNDGTINGATSKDFGNRSKSYYFDGSDDYIDLGEAAELDVAFPISIELGINSSNRLQDFKRVIAAPDSFTYDFHVSSHSSGTYLFGYGNNDDATAKRTAVAVLTNTWQHWVFVIETTAANNTYYLNGVEGTIGNLGGISKAGTDVYIGAKQGPASFFLGYIDIVRIYNRKIQPWEAKALYDEWKI